MLMRKKEIEGYILDKYKFTVKLWQNKLTGDVLKSKDLEKMILFEEILADCFNYNIKSGTYFIELHKKGKLIFSYEF